MYESHHLAKGTCWSCTQELQWLSSPWDDLITDSESWQLGGTQRTSCPFPSFHRWENWDPPGLSDRRQPTATVPEDPRLRPASFPPGNVLFPNPRYLFHGLETWKLIAPCWQPRIMITCLKSQGREPGATARPRPLSGFAFDISEGAQMVLWPHRRGKDQHANLNITTKDLLNAHCVQSHMLSSSGISKKVWAVISGVEWLSLKRGVRTLQFNIYQ